MDCPPQVRIANWHNSFAFSITVYVTDWHLNVYFSFGNVSSLFIMDDVACNGSESDIMQCTYNPTHNCVSSEGAGVRCTGKELRVTDSVIDCYILILNSKFTLGTLIFL